MDLNKELKRIDSFFENLSNEDFEKMAIECGIGEIEETPRLDLDDETIEVIKDRKNHSVEDFSSGYIVDTMTPEKYNEILKDPNCGIILCKSKIPVQILEFLELLRIAVYHNISDEEIKTLKAKFSFPEECDESAGDDGSVQ